MRLKRALPIATAVALMFALGACSGDEAADERAGEEPTSQENEATEPDLEGIPDVVAEVNGTEIDRDEFADAYAPQLQRMTMESQASGQEVDEEQLKKQVVDSLVNTELLVQEATERGFEASEEQSEETLTELAQQNGMESSDQFIAALEDQGMDRETIEAQVRDQVQIEQLLADEADAPAPSDQQVRELYRQLKAQQAQAGDQGQKIPPLAKVRDEIEAQLESQQQSEAANVLIERLRKDADIAIHI